MEELLTLLHLLLHLQLGPELQEPVWARLTKLVACDNVARMYRAGLKKGLGRLRRLALAFLVQQVEQLEQEVVVLEKRDVELVLGHDWLGVVGEARVVQLCLAWLGGEGRQEEQGLLGSCVRWSLLTPGERELLLTRLTLHQRQEVEAALALGRSETPREWPRLLLLVERPSLDLAPCSLRAWDFSSQRWISLSTVPVSRSEGWTDYSVAKLGTDVVLTASNSATPYQPVACLAYSPHSDSWTSPPPLVTDHPTNQATHATLALGATLYSLLVPGEDPREGEVLALHSGTPGGPWTVTGTPWDRGCVEAPQLIGMGSRLGIVQDGSRLLTYSLRNQSWGTWDLVGGQSKECGARGGAVWGTFQGRLVCVGGEGEERMVVSWDLEGGTGRPLGRLGRGRQGCGVGEARGVLWVAGGRAGGKVADSVEYYCPGAERWSSLGCSPGLVHPRVEVLEVLKPLRLVETELMFRE